MMLQPKAFSRSCSTRASFTLGKQIHRRATSVVRSAQSDSSPVPEGAVDDKAQQLTAVARVDVGDAIEQLTLPVRSKGSTLTVVTLTFPLGIVLEVAVNQEDGCIQVAEVQPGSSGAKKNVLVGDVVRGVTAASMEMTYPTMNLMFGGVGRPKLKRVALPTTGRSFQWLKEALLSNKQLPGDTVTLVLERPGTVEDSATTVIESKGNQPNTVFDPSLFE